MTKVLVAIASYGTKNEHFLHRLLDEYRSMELDVDVVVLSERPRALGTDVEVQVGLPSDDPKSLPFAHRALMAERADGYDLFVYSEDDTLIRQRNLEAFLEVAELLPDDVVPGFMRYELDDAGQASYSSVHSCFHWDPASAARHGGETFAHFTNHHSACFVLTRPHLKRAIQSGGFVVAPHRGESSMLVTAATDPYTQCELRRVICASRIDDFLLHHLPNVYLGRLGVDEQAFRTMLQGVDDVATGRRTADRLINPVATLPGLEWNLSFYPALDPDLQPSIPSEVDSALVLGCRSGLAERSGLGPSCRIVGIPQDEIIAAMARTYGIETCSPNLDRALAELDGARFDCLLALDVLHRLPDPVGALRRLSDHLAPGASLVATVPNLRRARLSGLVRRRPLPAPARFATWGVHPTTPRVLCQWLRAAGFASIRIDYLHGGALAGLGGLALRITGPVLGRAVVACTQHQTS